MIVSAKTEYACIAVLELAARHASGAGVSGGFTGWVFTNNVVYGGLASSYPAGNFFPAPGVPLINAFYGGSDFSLVPGSPYANAGTDGKALGADIGTLNTRTANVMAGAPTTATAAPAGRAL